MIISFLACNHFLAFQLFCQWAEPNAVKYNIKKEEEGSKINVATAKARAAVGAELMEKIDSISGGLKHVEAGQGVEGKPRTLMQDIRDAGGKTKKSQGRE